MLTAGYTLRIMHEGAKLKEVLERHHRKQADLHRAAGVSSAMASKYAKMESFGPGAWESISAALDKLGIDPNEVRPSGLVMRRAKGENLKQYLSGFSRKHLEAIKKILESDEASRSRLYDIIEDRLEQGR